MLRSPIRLMLLGLALSVGLVSPAIADVSQPAPDASPSLSPEVLAIMKPLKTPAPQDAAPVSDVQAASPAPQVGTVQVEGSPSPTPTPSAAPAANPALDEQLQQAATAGNAELVKQLLSQGANPNVQDVNGYTALMFASMRGYGPVVEALLNANPDVDEQDNAGVSALRWATQQHQTEVVKLLLSHGASPDLKAKDGRSVRDLAAAQGWKDVADLLKAPAAH